MLCMCGLQQDSYLQALVRAVQQPLISLQYPATIILARLITNDPSTHYIVAEVSPLPCSRAPVGACPVVCCLSTCSFLLGVNCYSDLIRGI